jgi:ABC-type antimicrobial peptide transport system permease subunit
VRRTLWPLAAVGIVVVVAVIAAGCGGTQSSSGTSTAAGTSSRSNSAAAHTSTASHRSAATPREKAVKLSECMRANGVSDFPDPNASGQFPSYGVSASPAVWRKAVAACKALQPPGTLSAKLTPAQESAALKLAQCIRENGVPDFPDPVNGQPLVDTTRIPSSNRPGGMSSKSWAVVIPVEAWSGGIASAILIGAFAGLMPAVRASRMPPTVALRTV